jgi:hypothetical protein
VHKLQGTEAPLPKSVVASNKIFPEKCHTNTKTLLSYTKFWLNLSKISNRKKIGVLFIKRSCSLGSLDKYVNEPQCIHDNTVEENDARVQTYEVTSTSTEIPKRFSENCLSDLCNFHIQNGAKLTIKHSMNSLESLCSFASLSSLDSIPRTSTIGRLIRTISNDTLFRDATISLTTSSYCIQSPRKDRLEGIGKGISASLILTSKVAEPPENVGLVTKK